MIERLCRRCLSLDRFPERGRLYGAHCRAVNEGRDAIICRVEPTRGRVVIVAVMHSSRDIRRILGIAEE